MIVTKKAVPRRTFLRGMGATLALPFLDAMVPALSAMSSAVLKPVRRMTCIYVPNGINMAAWTPKGVGTAFDFSATLTPIEPFRKYLTILSGLDSDPGESWGRGNGDHARAQPAWLTATHPKKAEAVVRGGVSLDQIVAQALGSETPLKSLELGLERTDLSGAGVGGYGAIYGQTISWRTPDAPLPMDNNPRTVFERMFGEGSTAVERLARMRRRRSVLDTIPDEIAGLQRSLGPSDRNRVNEYLYSIRDVERRIQMAEKKGAELEALVPNRPSGAPDNFQDHSKLMLNLQVLAYQADVTRVTTFLFGQEFSLQTFPEIGVPDAWHSMSHHQSDPEKLAKVAKIDTYHLQMLAHFLEKLESTPDGDGNLLDHSMILYGAGFSDGNTHAHVDLPLLVAGHAAGRLRGGRHIQYPKGTPMANLLLSMADVMGVPLDQIGDSTGKLPDFSNVSLSDL